MKKQITRTLVGLVMLLALVASASAQASRRVTIEVPFDFVAGQKHLPAGRYSVSRVQGSGAEARIHSFKRLGDGEPATGPESILYPLNPGS